MCDPSKTPAPTRAPARPANRQRLKLWELDTRLHCSVIGTCLSLEDLRQACDRAGLIIEPSTSDYDLHHAFVAMADRPAPAIRQLQRLLERRHRDSVARVNRCAAPADWEALWRQALAEGAVAGMYWALLTQAALPQSLRTRMTGEVHMLSHLSGARQRADLTRLHALERRVAALQGKLERSRSEQQRRNNTHADKVQRLQQRLREAQRAERQLQALREQTQSLEHSDLVRRLRGQVESYAAQLADTRLAKERAETALQHARQQREFENEAHCRTRALLHEVARERDALEQFVERALADRNCSEPCDSETCGNGMDLCGRCILYVGGRQSVTAHLSQLVQRCNGRLLCHDGGREDSRARLAALLPQADAVVCPVDCVSHDAYQRVKQFCKQSTKRLVLLPTASLSAFVRGLRELSPAAG